jgi:hypothetical protein
MRYRGLAAIALTLAFGFAVAAGLASPVSAARNWSITAAPPTLPVGVASNVSLTVTSGSGIKCVTVSVPSGFTVLSVSVVSAPGRSWAASKAGNGPTLATFATKVNGDRLDKGNARFVIRVIATRSPLPAWTAAAYHDYSPCSHSVGPPKRLLHAFGISPARPSAPAPPVSRPTIVPPTPSATPTDLASPSAAPRSSPAGSTIGGVSGGSGGASAGGWDGIPLDVQSLPAGGTVQVDISAVGGLGMFVWLVPGLFLSLPGLLLVLIVAAQAGFATAFVPVIRRVFGASRRARARPVSPA